MYVQVYVCFVHVNNVQMRMCHLCFGMGFLMPLPMMELEDGGLLAATTRLSGTKGSRSLCWSKYLSCLGCQSASMTDDGVEQKVGARCDETTEWLHHFEQKTKQKRKKEWTKEKKEKKKKEKKRKEEKKRRKEKKKKKKRKKKKKEKRATYAFRRSGVGVPARELTAASASAGARE